MSGCTASAAFCTSSWLTSTILPSTPKSVMTLMPKHLMPQWLATMTSGTVDMPTASAPHVRNILYSADINPIGFRVIKKALRLYPYQSLYFSTLKYGALTALFGKASIPSGSLGNSRRILLLTGIASPEQMKMDLEHQGLSITPLPFGDHHSFTPADVALVNETFAAMPAGSLIVTTEKDAVRLKDVAGLSEQVRKALYVLPIEVEILRNQQQTFNKSIIDYVLKNPRNSNLAEKQNGHDS